MTTKNKKKKPGLRLKKQTLAKLEENELDKAKGAMGGLFPPISYPAICGVSGHPLCGTTGGNHNRLAIAIE